MLRQVSKRAAVHSVRDKHTHKPHTLGHAVANSCCMIIDLLCGSINKLPLNANAVGPKTHSRHASPTPAANEIIRLRRYSTVSWYLSTGGRWTATHLKPPADLLRSLQMGSPRKVSRWLIKPEQTHARLHIQRGRSSAHQGGQGRIPEGNNKTNRLLQKR